MQAIAQSIVTAAPQVVDHITKPVASWEHYPACLGLPDLSMSQMHNVSLMLLARLYQPAGLDASAKVQALNTWLSSWQLELDKSITVFCKKLVGPTTRSEPVHVSIPKETKGFIGMMRECLCPCACWNTVCSGCNLSHVCQAHMQFCIMQRSPRYPVCCQDLLVCLVAS